MVHCVGVNVWTHSQMANLKTMPLPPTVGCRDIKTELKRTRKCSPVYLFTSSTLKAMQTSD